MFENYIRDCIIKKALDNHHKPYVYGGHGPDFYDCAGFVWNIYNSILDIDIYEGGFGISTTTRIMTSKNGVLYLFEENLLQHKLSNIGIGDIVLFHTQSLKDMSPMVDNKYPGHCGIYLGNYKFIHASKKAGKVVISSLLKNEYYMKVLIGSKSYLI